MRRPTPPRIVGVIFSQADFRQALQMRNPPDLFELRLDALFDCIELVKSNVSTLAAPIIITARHPREGGANKLTASKRRKLLLQLLPGAACVDLELRSLPGFSDIMEEAAARRVARIISFHDFNETPSAARLDQIAARARSAGADIIKVATRVDTRLQLKRLLDFYERQRAAGKVVAMGIGKLGRASRIELARRGCALNYGHLGVVNAPGQLSVGELRKLTAKKL